MRVAADTLNSAPAMQIRYLEAMQAMARSGQSKIIFMPGPVNSGDFGVPRVIEQGQASSSGGQQSQADPLQHAINARVFEDM
ncbi:hypothetical protein BU24DRAFT_426173 [Aaosphaeria arxii CBS 175.79]|uniref:Uncharacterized protein n=1 Tax=Aaosphaeria arxii CBS 175.79 TaxID=1450172 RepID=A0A6A5XGK1_9PLEO|nr:uncharacterized protein BU24DRAFT_426173 [Aaosphaeria arxii CBS 175.79]KAF2012308.1 hypothetical protein BU24DRAFT_426173 [Aaosphaeria arxii CBS 175.79]